MLAQKQTPIKLWLVYQEHTQLDHKQYVITLLTHALRTWPFQNTCTSEVYNQSQSLDVQAWSLKWCYRTMCTCSLGGTLLWKGCWCSLSNWGVCMNQGFWSHLKCSGQCIIEEYYKIILFYRLGWWCELAIVKRFKGWGFERQPFIIANLMKGSDKGLTLKMSAFKSLCGGQFTLSTQSIEPNYLHIGVQILLSTELP